MAKSNIKGENKMSTLIAFFLTVNISIIIFLSIVNLLPKYLKFKKSNYSSSSGNKFLETVFNKGNYGEYLTFSYLEKLDSFNRILTNVYIPKKDGTTTEIDLIMLSPSGIYVLESKNYSGWIFGDEKSKYWTQTLQKSSKNKFFNPIWQNKAHINALKNVLDIEDHFYISYIVFSERCKIKKIQVESKDVRVVKRNDLLKTIENDIKYPLRILDANKLIEIYSYLKQYSNVDESVKRLHIENLEKRNI